MTTRPEDSHERGPLRRARDAAGLTQEQLAERAGITRSALIRLELDGSRRPQLLTRVHLAHALACPPEQLFPDDDGTRTDSS